MASIEEIEAKLKQRQARKAIVEKQLKSLREELEMPFYKRIQLKHNKEQLKKVEETQLWVMNSAPKRGWNVDPKDTNELGREFMVEFLAGEIESVYEFLKERGYKRVKEC